MSAVMRAPGWQAHLDLGFQARRDRTVLAHRRHYGPLAVQRPFYPEGGPCHVYLLHPPGGVVGGDQLDIRVSVATGSHALITTPGATKFYRSAGPVAQQSQRLAVDAGAALEWMPQETILFDGCEVNASTRVDIGDGAAFAGWEILCLGRPASSAPFDAGHCRQRIELWRAGEPVLLERAVFEAQSGILHAPWGMNGCTVTATFVITPATRVQLDAAREAIAEAVASDLMAATLIDDVLVCRYLGHSAERARTSFTRIWKTVREPVFGRPACVPRIWNT
jgi:urease accessory protein